MPKGEMVELRRWDFPEVKQLVMNVRGPNGEEIPTVYYESQERRDTFIRAHFPPVLEIDVSLFVSQSFKGLPARPHHGPGGVLLGHVPAWVTVYQGSVRLFGHSGDSPRFRIHANEAGPQPLFAIADGWGYGNGPDGFVPGMLGPYYTATVERCARLESYEEVVPDEVLLGYLQEPAELLTPPAEIAPAGTVTTVTVSKVSAVEPESEAFNPIRWARGR